MLFKHMVLLNIGICYLGVSFIKYGQGGSEYIVYIINNLSVIYRK